MLNLMYDLPSQKNVKSFTITKSMIDAHKNGQIVPLPTNEVIPQKESA